jgi:hypothetical protein
MKAVLSYVICDPLWVMFKPHDDCAGDVIPPSTTDATTFSA